MTIERLLRGRHTAPAETSRQEEYAVMVVSSKDPVWGEGLELTFRVTARQITPDSDLDAFWSVGNDENDSDAGGKFNRARYRIMTSSQEEAISLALSQSIPKDKNQLLLSEQKKEGPLKRIVKKLHL